MGLVGEQKARMRSMIERFSMPPHLARKVALGELDLSVALLAMQRREVAEKLHMEGRIDAQGKSLVSQGKLSPEAAVLQVRVREHKRHPSYAESRLGELQGEDVYLASLGGERLQGRLEVVETYEIVLETREGPLTLAKHDLKFIFRAVWRKKLLKRGILWGPTDAQRASDDLSNRRNRVDIKARRILEAMDQDALITWTTIEGDQLRGRVTGFNRFEVFLESPQGAEVLVFRHGFGGLS